MRGAWRLAVDPTTCAGRGLYAEILPELVQLDDWGFPIVAEACVPGRLVRLARRAVTASPELALFLEPLPGTSGASTPTGPRGAPGVGTEPIGTERPVG